MFMAHTVLRTSALNATKPQSARMGMSRLLITLCYSPSWVLCIGMWTDIHVTTWLRGLLGRAGTRSRWVATLGNGAGRGAMISIATFPILLYPTFLRLLIGSY